MEFNFCLLFGQVKSFLIIWTQEIKHFQDLKGIDIGFLIDHLYLIDLRNSHLRQMKYYR